MAIIITMTRSAGDLRHEYDAADPVAFAEASKMLAECLERGGAAFSRKEPGGERSLTRELDPEATETLLRDQLAGG